tara:strand:- start:3277 stop:5340 length:2064 start_codon:yes stop_codon:yes gene_type:complete
MRIQETQAAFEKTSDDYLAQKINQQPQTIESMLAAGVLNNRNRQRQGQVKESQGGTVAEEVVQAAGGVTGLATSAGDGMTPQMAVRMGQGANTPRMVAPRPDVMEQGVTGLDTPPDMYNMNNGGVVGFAAGDYIQPFDIYDRIQQQESGGDPRAESGAGALGLMQIMPGTARDPGAGYLQRYPDLAAAQAPFSDMTDEQIREYMFANPQAGREFGERYYDMLLDEFDGDPTAALTAYNWGMGNVRKNMAAHDGELNLAAQGVPREAREYAGRVIPEGVARRGSDSGILAAISPIQAAYGQDTAGAATTTDVPTTAGAAATTDVPTAEQGVASLPAEGDDESLWVGKGGIFFDPTDPFDYAIPAMAAAVPGVSTAITGAAKTVRTGVKAWKKRKSIKDAIGKWRHKTLRDGTPKQKRKLQDEKGLFKSDKQLADEILPSKGQVVGGGAAATYAYGKLRDDPEPSEVEDTTDAAAEEWAAKDKEYAAEEKRVADALAKTLADGKLPTKKEASRLNMGLFRMGLAMLADKDATGGVLGAVGRGGIATLDADVAGEDARSTRDYRTKDLEMKGRTLDATIAASRASASADRRENYIKWLDTPQARAIATAVRTQATRDADILGPWNRSINEEKVAADIQRKQEAAYGRLTGSFGAQPQLAQSPEQLRARQAMLERLRGADAELERRRIATG